MPPHPEPVQRAGQDSPGPAGPGTGGPYLHAPILDADRFAPFTFFLDTLGFVPSLFRAQTLRPDIVEAQARAIAAILLAGGALGRVRRELVILTVSAAEANACLVAERIEVLRNLGVPEETSDQVVRDHRLADLSEADRALLDFARKLATRPGSFGAGDVEGLRHQGFDDAQILEAVVVTALAQLLGVLQGGLGASPDFQLREELFANLSSGADRPISEGGQSESAPEAPAGPDAELVERAREGDADAFEELVKINEKRVFRTLLGITGSFEDAEDCGQRVFLKAYERLGTFRATSSFSTWLTRIAINEGIERVRSRKPSESLDEAGPEEEAPFRPRQLQAWTDDPEVAYARAELKALVERELMRLPQRYRVAVLLRDIEQMSTAEAAAALGMGVPTLKTHLLRGRMMLREALAPLLSGRGRVQHA